MGRRFRLLPIVIAVAAVALGVRLTNLWLGISGDVASPAIAEAAKRDDAKPKDGADADTPKDGDAAKKDHGAAEKSKKSRVAAANPGADGPFDPTKLTDDELRIIQKLRLRRTLLEKREQEINDREKLLKAAETRIEARIAELQKVKKEIESLLKKHDAQQEAKLKSLVKIYENMKPKDAARIFERLDMGILLDVVERMRESKTAPIMASMEPGKAKSLTAALANRRALPKGKNTKTN